MEYGTDMDEIKSMTLAQPIEENNVLSLRASSVEEHNSMSIIEKEIENEEPDQQDTIPRGVPPLKYIYGIDQWSPLNTSGKKVYDRDFLIELRNDPNSKIKPLNLPDLDIVLKDIYRNNRGSVDLRQYKDVNIGRHDSLFFPGFVKSSQSARGPLAKMRGSQLGNPKRNKPAVILVSASIINDIELRKTKNPWKPTRLWSGDTSEEDLSTEVLYRTMRQVLNKIMPQNFNALLNRVKALKINSEKQLQDIVDMVFEKAVNEPIFVATYALMCKELATMQVCDPKNEADTENSNVNFRKLIITRCVMDFEEAVDENFRISQKWEIGAIANLTNEFQQTLTEQERIIRLKSFGNIRFIGELFRQEVLTTFIIHRCIRHLLTQIDDESLECLCKLLLTVGKLLESKDQNLDPYFKQILEIVHRKISGAVSSRVRLMLHDVIELRMNQWVSTRDYSNPTKMDQIQEEVESERLDMHLNNTPLDTPSEQCRNTDNKLNPGNGPTKEVGWSQPVRSSTQFSVKTSKLKHEPIMESMYDGDSRTAERQKGQGKSERRSKMEQEMLEVMREILSEIRGLREDLAHRRGRGEDTKREVVNMV